MTSNFSAKETGLFPGSASRMSLSPAACTWPGKQAARAAKGPTRAAPSASSGGASSLSASIGEAINEWPRSRAYPMTEAAAAAKMSLAVARAKLTLRASTAPRWLVNMRALGTEQLQYCLSGEPAVEAPATLLWAA
eukprot:scaffold126651_cov72-Phaeocystis_antarctica.AAC.3